MSVRTIVDLSRHFLQAKRWFVLPFLAVLLACGLLLLATSGLAVVAPFVYAMF